MSQKHIHSKEIKRWADGAIVQFYNLMTSTWEYTPGNDPQWSPDIKYRASLGFIGDTPIFYGMKIFAVDGHECTVHDDNGAICFSEKGLETRRNLDLPGNWSLEPPKSKYVSIDILREDAEAISSSNIDSYLNNSCIHNTFMRLKVAARKSL